MFDLDGTLINSAQDICNSANKVLSGGGKREINEHEIRALIGLPAAEIFFHVGINDLAENQSYVSKFRAHLAETGGSPEIVYPGVTEALSELVSRGNTLYVVTNKPAALAVTVLRRSGILHHFTTVQGSDGIAPKPSPQGILRCVRNSGFSNVEAVMIGDSPVDIKAAKAAGCSSIGVAYHDEIRDALVDSNPDKIVGSLQELVQS